MPFFRGERHDLSTETTGATLHGGFPKFFPESLHFSIDFPINPANQTNPITDWEKWMTFTFDFLQSHVAISANFARIDKNLVPINQGRSVLFVYQHLLAAYPLHSLCFFSRNLPSRRF